MSALLTVDGVGLRRSGRAVLSEVSFSLEPGEIVTVIGANGAGKTSLFEAILGFVPLDDGRILHHGKVLSNLADRARVFSFMPDDAEPPAEVRVQTLLEYAVRFGRAAPALAQHLTKRLGLAAIAGARAGELSRGERRRVLLFAALCTDRPVLVLDEPMGTFDPLQLLDVVDLLGERANAGAALLLSVHQLSDAEKIATRVLLLDAGRVLACASVAELRERVGKPHASLEEIFLLLLTRAHAAA